MIVKLIEDYNYKGSDFSSGTQIIVTREEAKALCLDGIAVANEDFPCEKRQEEGAKNKAKKNKKN